MMEDAGIEETWRMFCLPGFTSVNVEETPNSTHRAAAPFPGTSEGKES